ncbi:hypothetical protein N7539_009333 [Penicillium diatomitis]|uniref:FAD-binding PCMH-type domain-containing protein n=1 Tax=Penicillium diatomitis TaxID=2819901 RepID=A0A9X0BJL1_9EURO|nr:uncharacterized protein N7539_009333 [Penicillium diatomitis]KAJ5469715.1 hypothetical protein N7539_009333 [Penicillium diatomitis]
MALRNLLTGSLLGAFTLAGSVNGLLADEVPTTSDAGVPYFPSETLQLTDQALASLDKNQSKYFDFGTSDNSTLVTRSQLGCKSLPGDFFWPAEFVWSLFDFVLGGALIKTVPLAASCYPSWSEYDANECDFVTKNWTNSNLHAADSASVMWPLFEGRSCLPNVNGTGECTLGGYSSYAVNVSNVAQIQLAVNFARISNLRLVVKNTGHDFNGKSTGAGALGIWTHNMKELDYIPNYSSSSYSGPAVKMGAGVQASEIYAMANKFGFTAVGGEGKTVGVAGGYFLGGGHSPMSSIYGLAADQVLAMEVVLANGRFVTVTEQSDPDLFWALRGGGGGTFGIVTSVISRVHPKVGVTLSKFSFATGPTVSVDAFFEGVRSYMTRFPAHADAGTYAYFWVLPTGADKFTFLMNPFFAVNHTVDQFNALVKPWFDDLKALGIEISADSKYYDNFYGAWDAGFPLEVVGSTTLLTGSRLFPRANFENETLFNTTFDTLRSTLTSGHALLAFNMKAELPAGYPSDAANPAFRNALMHAITSTSWDATATDAEILTKMEEFNNDVLGPWRKTCPESGAYMSEALILEPNFQQAFYGSNYDRLYQLKQRYDPYGLFYAPTGVGSENWQVKSVDGLPDQNGRLCPV